LPKRATLQRPPAPVERHDLVDQHPQIKRAGVYYKKLIHLDEQDRDINRAARLLLGNFLTSKLPGSPHAVLVDDRKLAVDRPFSVIERVAPGAFRLTMGADVAPGVKPEDLREAMAAYVDGLATSNRPSTELDRLKQRFAADRATSDTNPVQAYNRFITWVASYLPPANHSGWPARVAAVTTADMTALAAGLAGPGKIVTGILGPAASAGSTPQ
jgi:zinc protease